MSADRRAQAEEIFAEAVEMPAGNRTAFIDLRCAGDESLKGEVRELLDVAVEAGGAFLDPNEIRQLTAAGSGLEATVDEPVLPEGARIGGYTIRGVLGAGGMGIVYKAEQERPRRTVALKVIRRGLGTRGVYKRFEHEAEALGRLQHPGIAQIYEAGTARLSGIEQPFIAMELVQGENLSKYAARKKLGTRERLALIALLCDAVQHAHQRGIIHRDLKPGNILVTETGEPKILDFGVARIAHADVLLTTLRTHIGQMIGTLAYMSPEQVLGNPADIDTRSDVYSLGVILYELLTGRLPHELASRSIPEAARIIREDAPTKLSHVSRIFRGEVDTIVSKTLEKNQDRRYQSASELADDIRRYLAGEPIQARADSALYVLRSQIRRYRWGFAAAALCLVALIWFALYATVRAHREEALALAATAAQAAAEQSGREARAERDAAASARDQLRKELSLANIERGRLEATVGNLNVAEELLWSEYLNQPESPAAKWGLWELHNRAPPLWTIQGIANVSAAAVSPSGGLILLASYRGELQAIDASDGHETARWPKLGGKQAEIDAIAIAPNGASTDGSPLAAIGTFDGRVVLLLVRPDSEPVPLETTIAHAGGVLCAAFSPDGTILATGGADRYIRLWDAATRQPIRAWKAHNDPLTALAFSPDGLSIASGSRFVGDGAVAKIWSISDGIMHADCLSPKAALTLSLAFAPDGRSLIVGAYNREFSRFDARTGEATPLRSGSNTPVSSVSYSPDGHHFAALGRFGVSFFDQGSDEAIRTVACTRTSARVIGWTDDASVVLTSADGRVRRLDVRPEPALTRIGLDEFKSWCFGVAFSPDGSRMAIGGGAQIQLADTRSPAVRSIVPGPTSGLRTRCVQFLDRGKTLATGSSDGILRIIDTASLETLAQMKVDRSEIYAMAVDPSETRIITGHMSGALRSWNLKTSTLEREWKGTQRRVEGLAISPDGHTVLSSGFRGAVGLWSLDSGELQTKIECSAEPWAVAWSPDGNTFAAGTSDGTIDVFDASTRQRRATIRAHARLVPGLCFSADSKLMASGSEDGRIKIWDVASLRTLISLEPQGGEIVGMSFDPTGSYLAASAALRFTALYDLKSMDRCLSTNIDYQRKRLGFAIPISPAPADPASPKPSPE